MSVYLITGSSRGLGRAITEAALAAGHQVVATARRPEQLDDFGAAHGDRVAPVALDVTEYDAATHAVQTAVERFGRLDVVVNNAGYADLASVEDMSIDAFRAQIDTNFLGVVNVTKASLPVLRAGGSGHIIQISSVGGRIANAGLSAYQSAKFAVGGFSEALAQEVGPVGIKITVLEPGGMGRLVDDDPTGLRAVRGDRRRARGDPSAGRGCRRGRSGQGRAGRPRDRCHGRTAAAAAARLRRPRLRRRGRAGAQRRRRRVVRVEHVDRPRRRQRRGARPTRAGMMMCPPKPELDHLR
jgi:NAD(P)-dependent dehydrogenase (short-subunit alcohol dehydrogenase family)